MPFSTLFEKTRSGVFNIVYQDAVGNRLASGSAFVCLDFLITNAHVFKAPANAAFVRVRNDSTNPISFDFTVAEFRSRLKASSDRNNFDFAVLDIPEILGADVYEFELPSSDYKVGDEIAFLGFPFEHDHVSIHAGLISSAYKSGVVDILQLDASVNASNSGGPLIDAATGKLRGIVTRKATGLTKTFDQLRTVIGQNVKILEPSRGLFGISDVDPIAVAIAGQNQMLGLLTEIERQANVGIGYAFSIKHLMEENIIHERIR